MIDGTIYWIIMIFCILFFLIFPLFIARHLDKKYGDKINGEMSFYLFLIIVSEVIGGIGAGFCITFIGK